jgi:hypothetical protein
MIAEEAEEYLHYRLQTGSAFQLLRVRMQADTDVSAHAQLPSIAFSRASTFSLRRYFQAEIVQENAIRIHVECLYTLHLAFRNEL